MTDDDWEEPNYSLPTDRQAKAEALADIFCGEPAIMRELIDMGLA